MEVNKVKPETKKREIRDISTFTDKELLDIALYMNTDITPCMNVGFCYLYTSAIKDIYEVRLRDIPDILSAYRTSLHVFPLLRTIGEELGLRIHAVEWNIPDLNSKENNEIRRKVLIKVITILKTKIYEEQSK